MIDPTVGPPISLAREALNLAVDELGTEEVPRGSNAGPRVEEYLHAVGLGPGSSWCAAFVSWCVVNAARNLGSRLQLRTSGGALQLVHLNHGLVLAEPEDACLVVWDHGHGLGHVGLVESFDATVLRTVEGNTDPAGSRNGYGVFRRERPRSDARIAGFVRVA